MGHFLALSDHTSDEIAEILDLARQLKAERMTGENLPLLKGKVLAMVFQKPSLRTRISFDMAMRHLGGDALFLSPSEIGLGKREAISDISRVLSGYVEAIMARVFSHDHVLELAEFASVPVINGLSDFNHPCQAMADALTMLEHFDHLEGLSLSYVGDGNNVATSLLYLSAVMGMKFVIASPAGYEISEETFTDAISLAKESGASIHQTQDPYEAVENTNIIYTDTWTSMGQEEETERRRKVFPPYQVNSQLLSAANQNAIVLHCLPAHRGEEITDEVADGPQSALFEQAENRMHAQKAILVHLLT